MAVLADGGNAMDAALAVNLVLAVGTPYYCGPGGDVFAIVWDGDRAHGYLGSGRSPAALTPDLVGNEMPILGPHTVTVPGAIAGWFDLLERFGSWSFADVAAAAIDLARGGVPLTARAAEYVAGCQYAYRDSPSWMAAYGDAETHLERAAAAELFELLGRVGSAAFYTGAGAPAIVRAVGDEGGVLSTDDLAAHSGEWCAPLRARYRDLEVLELPPPTQGVTALELLRILDGFDIPDDPGARAHLLVEATARALADRDRFVSDPDTMTIDPESLLADRWIDARRAGVDLDRASTLEPLDTRPGGTAYFCAADADGMLVSCIQSNFFAFGSGVHVPEWGIDLNNRGSSFSLDPTHANVLAPGKRPLHTLIPALGLRDGVPVLVFGTMGAHAQAQVHGQLLTRLVDDGADLQDAIDTPRWCVDPDTWRVRVESDAAPGVVTGLRARGHDVTEIPPRDTRVGHAQAIAVSADGYRVASDPRSEGAALGL